MQPLLTKKQLTGGPCCAGAGSRGIIDIISFEVFFDYKSVAKSKYICLVLRFSSAGMLLYNFS